MIEKGYFIITDITGYTIFLTHSELDHAHHIIQALFDSQLKTIGEPLKVSNFQGDAILCYVPEESIEDGTLLTEQIESIYTAFDEQMAAMQVDPPCGCNACANIAMLDLKIFVHYGEYMVKAVGDRDELLGSDVIVAHRMMKNDVPEKTGIKSYLLMSKVASDHPGVTNERKERLKYSETYEHIGEVPMYVSQLGSGTGSSFQPVSA